MPSRGEKQHRRERQEEEAAPAPALLPLAGWLLAAMAPPLVLRLTALARTLHSVGIPDLRGVLSDVGVGLAVAALAVAFARWRRAAGAAWVGVWGLCCYGNFEHILANGANASLTYSGYLTDSTFLLGSARSR